MSSGATRVKRTGHVSAFAARKQTAQPPLSDVSNQRHELLSAADEEDNDLSAAKKRKNPPATTAIGLRQQKIKKRKTEKVRNESRRELLSPRTPRENAPRVDASTAAEDNSLLRSATSSIKNLSDLPNSGFREGESFEIPLGHSVVLPDGELPTASSDISSEAEVEEELSSRVELQLEDEGSDKSWSVPDISAAAAPADRQLSIFSPTNEEGNGYLGEEWTISLKEDDQVTLIGQYEIWIRRGAVSILGAVLHQSSKVHRIYGPSTHSLPFIRPIRNPFGPANQQTVVTISSCRSGIRLLRKLSPRFGHIWNSILMGTDNGTNLLNQSKSTFQILRNCSDDALKRSLRPLEMSIDWLNLISTLTSQTSTNRTKAILVCGPKGSGKSTFSRMLVNTILTKASMNSNSGDSVEPEQCVALLDVDPGQPEYSPPGEISLVQVTRCNFGLPFTHPATFGKGVKPIRSHHIGATSPRNDPQHYLRCILDLFHYYKQFLAQYSSGPLIVNTAGWIQGAGLELLVDLVRHLDFTDIVYTSTQGPSEVTETLADALNNVKTSLHFLTSQPVEVAQRNAADLRTMQAISYFHLDEPEKGNFRWNARTIDQMRPLRAYYAGHNQTIYGVLLLGQKLDPEFLIQVLEGCVVGLVIIEDDTALHLPSDAADQEAGTDDGVSHDENDHEGAAPEPSIHSDSMSSNNAAHIAPQSNQDLGPSHHETPRERPSPSPIFANYNHTPSLPRTPSEQIPYIPPTNNITPPLTPTHTCSLGQAFVQSIDPSRQSINLITPIPSSTFDALHHQRRKIVLVRGSLDTPTWAYKEDLYYQMSRRKKVVKEGLWEGELEAWAKEDTRRWAEGRSWVRAEGSEKRERVRRVRRDLGRKQV